jgi:hypothetical protein
MSCFSGSCCIFLPDSSDEKVLVTRLSFRTCLPTGRLDAESILWISGFLFSQE